MLKVLLGLLCLGGTTLAQLGQTQVSQRQMNQIGGAVTDASGCVLNVPIVTLPTYQAASETRGTLEVQVVCARPTQRYRLTLTGWQITAQGDAVSASAAHTLRVEVLDAAPALGGQEWSGSQRLRFTLRVPAGQWGVSGGHYPHTLSVTLQQVGE
ncbi:hypothetical protein [Deinococcus petrolearius]|uniref:Spore coat protein U domain-containing protein n=1 Tax=Deinococcus petrolearius TaxID=1751295 RepID=A0ABW1DQ21_9DEIO